MWIRNINITCSVSAIPQKTGTSAVILALGAKNRSIGATKSFNSAVNDADALVFTTSLLNGEPQTSPPNKTYRVKTQA